MCALSALDERAPSGAQAEAKRKSAQHMGEEREKEMPRLPPMSVYPASSLGMHLRAGKEEGQHLSSQAGTLPAGREDPGAPRPPAQPLLFLLLEKKQA